jgi:nitrogen-specific signal transduction histidine kinase/ActR/RegA family two-component response regulator
MYDAVGKPAGVVGIARDITDQQKSTAEREQLEAKVQQAQKLESLGVLAGGIAHDFNNLLTSILGNADLALEQITPSSSARENLQGIETASRRAAELCRQLLAYSGKGRFQVRPIDLQQIVEEMAHLLFVSISKNAILKYNFYPNLPAIEADVAQIRQIVMNLITNASEAIGGRSGIIRISTGALECDEAYLRSTFTGHDIKPGLYVSLEVSDTGCGMDASAIHKIFDPFYTTKFTGRGLGLAAVLGIVRSHHGAIKVYSEPGKGSTFKLLFPASESSAFGVTEGTKGAPWSGHGKVLLVDDESTVRDVGRQMLQRAGLTVLTAPDGEAALEVFRREQDIDCVVLDLTMPRMDGEACFRELRRLKPGVKVILSSGYNEQDVINRFVGKGLAGFIQKPYVATELLVRVREAFEGQYSTKPDPNDPSNI